MTPEEQHEKALTPEQAHTPLPWHLGPHYKSDVESRHGRVAECRSFTEQGETDAEFIVRACNSHDELLAALKAAQELLCGLSCGGGHHCGECTNALEAIAKAEAK